MSVTSLNERKPMDSEKDTFLLNTGGRPEAGIAPLTAGSTLALSASPCGTLRTVSVGRHTLTLPVPRTPEPSALYNPAKRAIDVSASVALLVFLFPVFLVIAFLIYFEDRGPILYYQTRVGRDGKTFLFYKFRSMVTNADQIRAQLEAKNEAIGPIFKMKSDPRITRIGRFIRRYSLDELPQLFNVMRGR